VWWPISAKARRSYALRVLYRADRQKGGPDARGMKLLRAWLSPEQRVQFDKLGYFDVRGSVSGKRYRIHFGAFANVEELSEAGTPRCGWCFVPIGHLVRGDVMLAQKIALETSEAAALAVANQLVAVAPAIRRHSYRPF
jgi:hypothetical protein